ncbi:hypothetical protein M422DRAFT_258420 [Sphaerobolus stellatus SS14]|uniref:Unplaced genomic scaffold SPHSTscaffold_82, whole genome shotgun sequence n=1 Tax=Sphaerobolus stellatus (strain SS14) TaxID=990650 RepID=A0A0C9U718_SPHS4|nr:hypothetical protein M422DRAFT_258420 [Sphaerobolus stellatus SS14]
MTTPFEPTYTPAVHAVTPFGHDHDIIVWRYFRTTSDRHPNGITSPQYVKSREKIVLSAFNFQIPYAMNTRIFLAPYNKWFRLISRAPISEKEEDGCSMDYKAVLVHTDHNDTTQPTPSTGSATVPPPLQPISATLNQLQMQLETLRSLLATYTNSNNANTDSDATSNGTTTNNIINTNSHSHNAQSQSHSNPTSPHLQSIPIPNDNSHPKLANTATSNTQWQSQH